MIDELLKKARVGFEYEAIIPSRLSYLKFKKYIINEFKSDGLPAIGNDYLDNYDSYIVHRDGSVGAHLLDFYKWRPYLYFHNMEFSSRIIPWGEHMDEFIKVRNIINKHKGWTNSSTGCHWNVSYSCSYMNRLFFLLPLLYFNWLEIEETEAMTYNRYENSYCKSVSRSQTILVDELNIFNYKDRDAIDFHESWLGINKTIRHAMGKFKTLRTTGLIQTNSSTNRFEIRLMGGKNYQNRTQSMQDTLMAFHTVVSNTLQGINIDRLCEQLKAKVKSTNNKLPYEMIDWYSQRVKRIAIS